MSKRTCPYARGTDSLKMHWLWMPEKEAKAMDKRIEEACDPPCGKPVHPGSAMCKEHLRFYRTYQMKHRPIPYPVGGKNFTCQHSPSEYGSEKRWVVYDKGEHGAGVFETEEEAKKMTDVWNLHGAEVITMDWKCSEERSDDSDRGTYIIGIEGTKFRETIRCGWHSDEAATHRIQILRNMLVKHGKDAVIEILTTR